MLHTQIIGDSRIEQDPHEILASIQAACAPLLERYPATIAGLDNQGESFLVWDRHDGTPLTPAISWQDKRGAAICAELEASGYGQLVREKTGLLLDSYFSAPKLAHELRSNPELRRKATAGELCFGTLDSWIIWKLSPGHAHLTDPSTAARTLLFNIHRLEWDAAAGAF